MFQVCSDQRLRMGPKRASDLAIINLNHDIVREYKKQFGITKEYSGTLLRLVDVEFPDELEFEGEAEPPTFDHEPYFGIEDEIYEDSEPEPNQLSDSSEEDESDLEN